MGGLRYSKRLGTAQYILIAVLIVIILSGVLVAFTERAGGFLKQITQTIDNWSKDWLKQSEPGRVLILEWTHRDTTNDPERSLETYDGKCHRRGNLEDCYESTGRIESNGEDLYSVFFRVRTYRIEQGGDT